MTPLEQVLEHFCRGEIPLHQLDVVTDQSLFDLVSELKIKSQELLIVLDELVMNSVEHGHSPEFFYQSTPSHFYFVISDKGPGVHEHVPRNPRLSDTRGKSSTCILRLALEEGITGTGTVGRGMGLFYLSQFVRDHSGECLIASNKGYVKQTGHQLSEGILQSAIVGTVVILKVSHTEVGV